MKRCMSVLEVSADDQFLVAGGETPLLDIYAALPPGLHPPFPRVELPGGVGGLILRGGFGQRFFFGGEVLGAVFRTPSGRVVQAGGRVVKNVQGFDLVRPLVGSFGLLGEVLSVTLRLRPGPASVLLVREGDLNEVPEVARFAWQDGARVYVSHFGPGREVERVRAVFGGEVVEGLLDYRARFPDGMATGAGALRDGRFSWVNGTSAPPVPPLFARLARALAE